MAENENTTHEGRRRQTAHAEPVGALATGSAADVEETRRKQAEADEARAQQINEAEGKAAERREAIHKATVEQTDAAFKTAEENYAKSRETMENRRKEEARRATLSPAQRAEEDQKIADMTPDERAKFFLETGRTIPLEQEGGIITPLAATPSYPVLTQHQAPTEFILSEANGQRSRANAYLADPVMVYSGSLLKQSVAETQNAPATYVLAAVGADADAIALYGGTSVPVNGLRISVLVRDAEVNKHCITWAPLAGAEIDAAIAHLATHGIICR